MFECLVIDLLGFVCWVHWLCLTNNLGKTSPAIRVKVLLEIKGGSIGHTALDVCCSALAWGPVSTSSVHERRFAGCCFGSSPSQIYVHLKYDYQANWFSSVGWSYFQLGSTHSWLVRRTISAAIAGRTCEDFPPSNFVGFFVRHLFDSKRYVWEVTKSAKDHFWLGVPCLILLGTQLLL